MTARTVVVAHREMMVAEGIAAALSRYPGIVPIAVATTASECERNGKRADAVALDEHLPGAASVAGRLRRSGARVVFLGQGDGGDGIKVSMTAPVSRLATALVPQVVTDGSVSRLTRREQQILALVAGGLAGKQVARHLGISPKTVERHKTSIYSKLGVPNQAAAVGFAMSNETGKGHQWNHAIT